MFYATVDMYLKGASDIWTHDSNGLKINFGTWHKKYL